MKTRPAHSQPLKPSQKVPFIEHVYELRKRLFYIVASVGIFGCIAYAFEHYLIAALLKPAKDQEFIYTSPGGGLDFLFRVCLYAGIACSIPVIIYQLLKYIEPLLKHTTQRLVLWGSMVSGLLALIGIVFGYFVGLPSGLDFLLHQFKTDQIQPLITIHSYMNFVMLYLLGSAMLLQIPLILLFINRIKPLQPKKLLSLSAQRWVILGAFIGSAVINASPQLMAQLVIAGPIILSYEIGVGIIWYTNRKLTAPGTLQELRQRDAEITKARLEAAQQAKPLLGRQASAKTAASIATAERQSLTKQKTNQPRISPPAVTAPSVRSASPAKPQKLTGTPRLRPTQRPRQYGSTYTPRSAYQLAGAQRFVQ